MYIEEAGSRSRNLDSVQCKVRDDISDEPILISLSDLSGNELRRVLSNCSVGELRQVIGELSDSFRHVISLFQDEVLESEDKRVLFPVAYGLADTLRYFGDYHEIALDDNYWSDIEQEIADTADQE